MSASTAGLSSDPWSRRDNGVQLDTEIGQIGVLDAATIRRAQLAVCDRAADVEEAAEVLAMLGIGGGS